LRGYISWGSRKEKGKSRKAKVESRKAKGESFVHSKLKTLNAQHKIMTKIIDSHHHLWQFNEADYGWMDESMAILRRDYLPGDLQSQLSAAGVDGTVVVQARQKLEETAWLLKQSEENEFIKGVVGWVDLRSEDLASQLKQFASHPKLLGVRHVIHDEADDDFMLGSDFIRGIDQLAAYDLSYDLLLFPKHLKNACKLVSRFPGQRFVLDHISKPQIKAGIVDPWKDDIAELASYPNVWCKISGMVTEADLTEWKYDDFVKYLDVIVKTFGTDRIMLGSDWPVCRLAGEYADIMSIPNKYFDSFEEGFKERIFSQNCVEFYKLKL
jgi:L-fuconolactonase